MHLAHPQEKLKRLDISQITSLRRLSVDIDNGRQDVETRAAFPGWLAENTQRFPSEHPLSCLVFNISHPEPCLYFADVYAWSPVDETVSTRGQIRMVFNLKHRFGAEVLAAFCEAIKAALPRSYQSGLVSFGWIK